MSEVEQRILIAAELSVGRLSTTAQFVLWALRQRVADGEPASPRLTAGFRFAFGLAGIEPAMAAFEDLLTAIARTSTGLVPVAPLTCACIAVGEAAMLALIGGAGCGGTPARGGTPIRGGRCDLNANSATLVAASRLALELRRADLDGDGPRRPILH